MRNLAIVALLAAGLAGCASPGRYGNFVADNAPANLNEVLATDSVKRLVTLYPPARTRFKLGQPTPDAYGAGLLEGLRAKGYAVAEFNDGPATTASKEAGQGAAGGVSLRYVVDAPASNLYRVTVTVGPQALSRAYRVQDNKVSPAGAWSRSDGL